MKNLIKLQLKKGFLTFAVIFGTLLASVPIALAVKEKTMSPRDAINLAMLYWAFAGIPLTALLLSGIAGAEAAGDQAKNTEQPLPVSQYGLLLSSLAAVLLQVAALFLALCAILGFNLPLETLNRVQEELLRSYVFAVVYLSFYGFTISYAFRNGIAGAALAVAAAAFTLYPFVITSVFQQMAFELIPMWFIKPAVAAAALAGGALALKILSGINDRKEAWTAARLAAIIALLAAAPLSAFTSLAWLNLKARNVTLPVTSRFYSHYSAGSYLSVSEDVKEASRLLLVQRPFYGDAFFIDKDGKRSVIDAGREQPRPGPAYLFPDLTFGEGESVTSPAGEKWVLYGSAIYQGSAKDGFIFRGTVNKHWRKNLVGGKEPGLLDRGEDGYYYSPLPAGKTGKLELNWKKIGTLKEGHLSFIGEKYRREGTAAVFRKDGKTLEYRGQTWTIPDAAGTRIPLPGVALADGLNFIVAAESRNKEATYLCRPGGKVEPLWPEYFRLGLNLSVTPDGAVWGVGRKTAVPPGSPMVNTKGPEFYVLTSEGIPLSAVSTFRILKRTGVTRGEIRPLKAGGGYLWFNADNRYMVRAGIKNGEDLKIWRLPEIPVVRGYYAREGAVSPSPEGVFITAADGVYFMDWEGNEKKIY